MLLSTSAFLQTPQLDLALVIFKYDLMSICRRAPLMFRHICLYMVLLVLKRCFLLIHRAKTWVRTQLRCHTPRESFDSAGSYVAFFPAPITPSVSASVMCVSLCGDWLSNGVPAYLTVNSLKIGIVLLSPISLASTTILLHIVGTHYVWSKWMILVHWRMFGSKTEKKFF